MLGSDIEIIVYAALFATLIGAALWSMREGMFSPFFMFFAYLIVGIGLRRLYLADVSNYEDTAFWLDVLPSVQDDFLPAYLELGGTLAIMLVSSRFIFRFVAPRLDRFFEFFALEGYQIPYYVTYAVGVTACMGFFAGLVVSEGGLREAFSMLQKRAIVFGSDVFFLRLLVVVFSVSVCLLVYKVSEADRRSSLVRKLMVLALAVVNLGLLFLTGGRGDVVTQLLVLIFVRSRGLKKPGVSLRDAAFLGVSTVVVVVTGLAIRTRAQQGGSLTDAFSEAVSEAGIDDFRDVPILDLYLAARNFAQEKGHDFGMQFLLYTTRFVPRSIWEDKPDILGMQIREYYTGSTLSGAPPTMFGEFYIAWGVLGCVICGLFLGFVLSLLRRLYYRSKNESEFSLLYIALAAGIIFNSLRAGLEIGVFAILYFVATLAVFRAVSWLHFR